MPAALTRVSTVSSASWDATALPTAVACSNPRSPASAPADPRSSVDADPQVSDADSVRPANMQTGMSLLVRRAINGLAKVTSRSSRPGPMGWAPSTGEPRR